MKNENVLGQDGVEAPSSTNPQCKVCTSPDRFEIEVALAQDQPQETVARRFSRNGQSFSRQNIHTHYHKPYGGDRSSSFRGCDSTQMRRKGCLISTRRWRSRNRTSAPGIGCEAQVQDAVENNLIRFNARDVMAFMEQDARLGDQRSAAMLETFKSQASAFMEAVKSTVPPETWGAVVEAFNRLMDKNGGPTDVFYQRDVPLGEEARQA